MIFLLLKQHQITGLKYLCKCVTKKIGRCFTYTGSGKYWKQHLRKHGNKLSTTILEQCLTKTEFCRKAKKWSAKLNVVRSKEFANLIPEQGDGGDTFSSLSLTKQRKVISKRIASIRKLQKTKKYWLTRKAVGLLAKQRQQGKTMQERLGNNFVDPRKGRKWNEIYNSDFAHPQIKPFSITCNGKQWNFTCESEFKKVLHLNPDPTLRLLKQLKQYTIKKVSKRAKHSFRKGDTLNFNYLTKS